MGHKRTFKAYRQGGVLRVATVGSAVERRVVASRGTVEGFSRKSRKRMIESILRLDMDAMGQALFLTLTYPAEYPSEDGARENLRAFWERVKRKFGAGVSALWRLELQKRGAPHFHLVIWGVGFMGKEWVAQAWYDVVGSGEEAHLRAGTRIEGMRTSRGVVWYVAKYASKGSEEKTSGRVWGFMGRKNLIFCDVVSVELDQFERDSLESYYTVKVGGLFFAGQGFTLYGDIWKAVGVESGIGGSEVVQSITE